jgi:hypothetical protein
MIAAANARALAEASAPRIERRRPSRPWVGTPSGKTLANPAADASGVTGRKAASASSDSDWQEF